MDPLNRNLASDRNVASANQSDASLYCNLPLHSRHTKLPGRNLPGSAPVHATGAGHGHVPAARLSRAPFLAALAAGARRGQLQVG